MRSNRRSRFRDALRLLRSPRPPPGPLTRLRETVRRLDVYGEEDVLGIFALCREKPFILSRHLRQTFLDQATRGIAQYHAYRKGLESVPVRQKHFHIQPMLAL